MLCLFVLLTITMVAALGLTSIIAQNWKIDEDNVFLFGTIIMALSIIFGVALSFAYSAIIVKASKPYLNALQKVAEGDFSVRIEDSPIFANFNIAKNFNYMTSQLQGVETLRENFVSAEVELTSAEIADIDRHLDGMDFLVFGGHATVK